MALAHCHSLGLRTKKGGVFACPMPYGHMDSSVSLGTGTGWLEGQAIMMRGSIRGYKGHIGPYKAPKGK